MKRVLKTAVTSKTVILPLFDCYRYTLAMTHVSTGTGDICRSAATWPEI